MKKILHLVFLFIMTILIVASFYMRFYFPDATVEELLFYINNGVGNSDFSVFIEGIKICLPYVLFVYFFLIFLFYDLTFNHKKKFYPITIINNKKGLFSIILVIITILLIFSNLKVFSLIKNSLSHSNFIEQNYVNSKNVKINFEQKRNLIMIVSESLESTVMDKENGGKWSYDIIPELSELLKDEETISFINSKGVNGMKVLTSASWTTSSVITNTTAIPFKVPLIKKFTSNDFLNGVYSLGDLLYDNGYHNEVISAASTSFGGLKEYFQKHGKYDIIDIDSYQDYNLKLNDNDLGLWGFNDNYLFNAAKERLEVLSKQNKPFNLELISIDTHFPDGYIGDYSLKKYKNRYENVYATQSKLIYDFVLWVKQQPFYEDTLIVIIGDHLSMKENFFNGIDKNERYVYTCYINPFTKTKNTQNRIYTALDTYPTILGAMGVSIENNQLGLGINMFSDDKTLAEKFGIEKIDNEFQKKSNFYNKNILN